MCVCVSIIHVRVRVYHPCVSACLSFATMSLSVAILSVCPKMCVCVSVIQVCVCVCLSLFVFLFFGLSSMCACCLSPMCVCASVMHVCVHVCHPCWLKETPPFRGRVPIYYVPSSRTVSKRTPLEAPGTNSSRRVLLLTILDEGT